jgi:putative inorganic carbon (HCO3(-)) transporter
LEPVVVVVAAPFLLFPTFWSMLTVAALVALVVVWLSRWIGSGWPATPTPVDLALLLFSLMLPLAVWASAVPHLTLPKLTGLILGIAAFRALVNAVDAPGKVGIAAAFYLALGFGLCALGLVGTSWSGKFLGMQPLLARLPSLIRGLPGAELGIHANELAGTLLLFLPVAVAVAGVPEVRDQRLTWVARLAGLALAVFLTAMLVLTESRSAWAGALAGLGSMALLRWRWARWLALAVALILLVFLLVLVPANLSQALVQAGAAAPVASLGGGINLEGRIEIWSRALYGIQDFPFTGIGLGAFREVVHLLYPLFLTAPGSDIAHAHNVFLQVALDLGLPGLVAYLALVGLSLWICWRVAAGSLGGRRATADNRYRWLAHGILGALVGFHVYGLADTVALGAKPGMVFWMLIGMAAAIGIVTDREQGQAVGTSSSASIGRS